METSGDHMRTRWLAGVLLCAASPVLAQQHGEPDLAVIRDNPVSHLISVPFRFSYHCCTGGLSITLGFRPVGVRFGKRLRPGLTRPGLFFGLPLRACSSVTPIIAAIKMVGFPGNLACTAVASAAFVTARLTSTIEGGAVHGRHHHRYRRHRVTRKHFDLTCPGIAARVSNVLSARRLFRRSKTAPYS
jgi:type IV secretory pathway VirB3-like protein